jgi:hypothetical protein
VLCGLWSAYHLLYLIIVLGGVYLLDRDVRRSLRVPGSVAVALVVVMYGKNLVLFDRFATSSWLGMSVAKVITHNVPPEQRQAFVESGTTSPLARIEPFSPLESYPDEYVRSSPWPVDALRNPRKSNGEINFNHYGYIGISAQYLRDALAVARAYPRALIVGLLKAWFLYFQTSSDYDLLVVNGPKLAGWAKVYDVLLYGKLPFSYVYNERPYAMYSFLILGLPLVLLYAAALAARGGTSRTERIVLGYLVFNVVYLAIVANSVEFGENNRFRFSTDPLSLVLLGVLLERWGIPNLRRVRGAAQGSSRRRAALL